MTTAITSRRILVVEDQKLIRELSIRALTNAGYLVDAAENGQSGWEALQARRYDLVITDNRMPELSGHDLILKLRSARMRLPVILASGHILPEHLAMGSALQPVTALPNPFTPDQLLAVVVKVLRLARHDLNDIWSCLNAAGESCLHWGLNE